MAARITRTNVTTNNTYVGKKYYGMAEQNQGLSRPALGSIHNTVTDRDHHVPMKQKTVNFKSAVLPPTHIAAPSVLPIVKDDITTTKEDSPDVESMDVVQMSEAFSEQLIIDHDIDLLDAENPQFCSEYAKDIYQYMRDIEKNFHTPPVYMSKQTEINEKMRAILVDWLIQVHNRFNLLQETLYLTVSIIDRYLQSRPVPKAKLQLVGVTAMLIASKYEEMYAPEVRDFVYITANTYSSLDIQNMESEMLRALDYSFGNPLCLHFLRRNSRAGDVTPEIHMMAKFLLELCLTEYSILKYVPSQLSAAALYISKKLYNDTQWTPVLRYYSTYAESDLLPCVKEIAHVALNASISKQQAVVNKYNGVKYLRISKEPRLTGKIMKELANN